MVQVPLLWTDCDVMNNRMPPQLAKIGETWDCYFYNSGSAPILIKIDTPATAAYERPQSCVY